MHHRWRAWLATVGLAMVLLTVVLSLQKAGGAYDSEFGGHPDEAAHYVTGLMVRDYAAAGFPGNPLRFAREYYEHYPKVAIGHWPPGFYLMQALWTLPCGASRVSILLFMAVLTTVLALLFFRFCLSLTGWLPAAVGAVLLVCLPRVQQHAGMVMAEIPMAIWTLLAVWCWARFLERGRWQDSLGFGLFASVAILTKGTGLALALVPPLTVLLLGRFELLRTWRFWAPAGLVLILAGPWTILTLGWVRGGMLEDKPSLAFILQASPYYSLWLVKGAGVALFVLAVLGAFGALLGGNRKAPQPKPPQWPGESRPPHAPDGDVRGSLPRPGPNRSGNTVGKRERSAALAALVLGGLLFHWCVPCGLEARHLVPLLPPLLALAVGPGLHLLSQAGQRAGLGAACATALAVALLVGCFGRQTFFILRKHIGGFRAVAEWLERERPSPGTLPSQDTGLGVQDTGHRTQGSGRKDLGPAAQGQGPRIGNHGLVVLISSDARGEGMFIAEMAMRGTRPKPVVCRASKLLAESQWSGAAYRTRAQTPEQVRQLLDAAGVQFVVVDSSMPVDKRLPHHEMLRQLLAADPARCVRVNGFPVVRGRNVWTDGAELFALRPDRR